MAWDEFESDGQILLSGDKPVDTMAIALAQIAQAYRDRFDRNPFMAEILHALETVIGADPGRYVADPDGLDTACVKIVRS